MVDDNIEEDIMRTYLLGSLALVAFAASSCADSDDNGYDCHDLGALLAECYGGNQQDDKDLICSYVHADDPDTRQRAQCMVDCAPDDCNAYESCDVECLGE